MREQLKREAKGYDMCSEYFDRLDESKQNLISYYKQNPNECMEHSFPSIKLLEDYFNDDETRSECVFVSQNIDNIVCDKQVYIFNNCNGSIDVIFNRDDKIFPIIYLGHNSNLKINIHNSRTPIYLYNSSKVEVNLHGKGQAIVFRYDEQTEIKNSSVCDNSIKIINKYDNK